MRIGLAGVGRIGAFHAATLRDLVLPQGSLVVADLDPASATRVAHDLGVEHEHDTDSLLESGLDGLVIATATTAHAELLRRSVARGIPTFCEKPVATTLVETVELARLVDGSGVPVQSEAVTT